MFLCFAANHRILSTPPFKKLVIPKDTTTHMTPSPWMIWQAKKWPILVTWLWKITYDDEIRPTLKTLMLFTRWERISTITCAECGRSRTERSHHMQCCTSCAEKKRRKKKEEGKKVFFSVQVKQCMWWLHSTRLLPHSAQVMVRADPGRHILHDNFLFVRFLYCPPSKMKMKQVTTNTGCP